MTRGEALGALANAQAGLTGGVWLPGALRAGACQAGHGTRLPGAPLLVRPGGAVQGRGPALGGMEPQARGMRPQGSELGGTLGAIWAKGLLGKKGKLRPGKEGDLPKVHSEVVKKT